jgi:ABC-type sugar transport system permease subunit
MPVLAVLWTMLYRPTEGGQMGLINMLVDVVGLSPVDWLHNPATALPAIAFMSIWQGVGFQMMIFLAGLQHISGEQLEAAKIDGAGPVARLFYVTIPGLKNSIIFAITMTTVLAFRLFVQPYLMTGGGPADRTLSVIQWIYEAATAQFSLGLACAAAILFLVVVAVLLIAQRALTREQRA